MAQSHIKQTLPLRNRVVPTDNNTSFLAHYDLNANDVLRGIKPIGERHALEFDGAGYVQTGFYPGESLLGQQFTWEFWHYYSRFASDIGSSGSGDNPRLYTQLTNTSGGLRVAIGDSFWTATTLGTTNTWYHIAITFNNGTVKTYINGELRDTNEGVVFSGNSASSFDIGRGFDNIRNLEGKSGPHRIWKKVLTQKEIQEYMNKDPVESDPDLVAYWKLNEGEGQIISDYSQNGNDGTVYGGATWGDGQSIYTLNSDNGYFGGGIAIEEATTNLAVNPTFEGVLGNNRPNDWSYSDQGTIVELSELVESPWGEHQAYRIKLNNARSYLFNNQGFPVSQGDVITISIRITGTTNAFQMWWEVQDGNGTWIQRNASEENLNHLFADWYYCSIAITEPEASSFFLRRIGVGTSGTYKAEADITFQQLQVEKKSFSTSFTSGSRGPSFLQYPLEVNPNDFTLSFWAKLNNRPYMGEFPFYINIYQNGVQDQKNRIWIRPSNNTTLRAGVVSSEFSNTSTSDIEISNIKDWHMYALILSDNNLKVYFDGEFKRSLSVPTMSGTNMILDLSGLPYGNKASAVFDEVRIDKGTRTDDEIMSWYYSQSAFYPRGIYKAAY